MNTTMVQKSILEFFEGYARSLIHVLNNNEESHVDRLKGRDWTLKRPSEFVFRENNSILVAILVI